MSSDYLLVDEYSYIDVPTPFTEIYNRFLGKITDDMYFELTPEDTQRDLKNLLLDAIPGFEFPRFPLYDYDEKLEVYNCPLTSEEINILAILMYNGWLQRQIASIENTRMKYGGPDFKMTSQANHLDKLMKLKQEAERQNIHMQRLYKRRKIVNSRGYVQSNWSSVMEMSAISGKRDIGNQKIWRDRVKDETLTPSYTTPVAPKDHIEEIEQGIEEDGIIDASLFADGQV